MLGTSFAHYRITSKLGEGGMGEVWRATDGKLHRDVAVKILPEAVCSDPARLARFAREAQLLAALSHPNIGQVYGLEERDGRSAIILELIEGETLAGVIARGPVAPAEARRIAVQIADALEAAHHKGIIHRDLKPANVKLTPDGTVKVLDFGLAKSLDEDPAPRDPQRSPTLTAHATQAGVLMGTAGYMSPEQAKGSAVDERADIWAFGVLLFEMLTGRELFTAPSVPETLANVLTRAPEFHELPRDTPASMRRALRLCLTRDPKKRLRSIADARILLEDDAGDAVAVAQQAERKPRSRAVTCITIAAIAVVGLSGWLVALLSGSSSRALRVPQHFSIVLDAGHEVGIGTNATLAFSPDGSSLVFSGREGGRRALYRRDLAGGPCSLIPGTEQGDAPFFSPDGRWIVFISGGRYMKIPAEGGRAYPLAEARGAGGGAWLSDGTFVYAPLYSDGLYRVRSEGGEPARLSTPNRKEGELGHWWPWPLPGEQKILFTAFRTPVDTSRIGILDLETKEITWVVDGGFFARYLPSGHILYAKGQRLYALPFDVEELAATGPAVPVLDDVFGSQTSGFAAFAVSSRGTIAYVSSTLGNPPRELAWIDRSGRVEPALGERHRYLSVSLSPDDRDAAVSIQGESRDIWVYSFARGVLSRLTTKPTTEFDPRFSRDGREIFYVFDHPPFELHRIEIGAPDSGRQVWNEETDLDTSNPTVSPDGRILGFTLTESGTGQNVYVRPIDGSAPRRAIRATPSEERHLTFSPDGRFVAYQSDETGRPEIYVEPFSSPGERIQISADGGTEPEWAANGELFFRHADEMRAVTTRTAGRFESEAPRTLFTLPFVSAVSEDTRVYSVTRDGSRVLAIRVPGADRPRQIEIVTDWMQSLAKAAPPSR